MAIKVNGTTVINDNRALSNIASVDATTATAFGNAGVGGLSTVVATDASMGTGSSLSFTLGDYQIQHFYFEGPLKHNADLGKSMYVYFSDSSGTTITSGEYQAVARAGSSSGSSRLEDYLLRTQDINRSSESTRLQVIRLTVYDAYSSTKRTKFDVTYHFTNTSDNTYDQALINIGVMQNAEKNNSVVMLLQNGGTFTENGAKYSSIGVN